MRHVSSIFVTAFVLAGCASARSGGTPNPGSSDAGAFGQYASPGPDAVTSSSFMLTSPAATFGTTVYIPSGSGPHPVVILLSGFFQEGEAYAAYAQRLASWGIVTLLRDDPGISESTADMVSDVGYEVDSWLPSQNEDSTSALYGRLDTTRIGLAGHSRGGQVALLAGAALRGKIEGVFGLDPVDSTTPPEASVSITTIGLPLAFIGETTDDADAGCAPANVDFLALYAAAPSPAVAISVPNADHTMFEDRDDCEFCNLCVAGTANQAMVEGTAVRYLTAYFARQLLGDSSVGPVFAGAGATVDLAAGTILVQSK